MLLGFCIITYLTKLPVREFNWQEKQHELLIIKQFFLGLLYT